MPYDKEWIEYMSEKKQDGLPHGWWLLPAFTLSLILWIALIVGVVTGVRL